MSKKLVSIVIPAYREEKNISYIYHELQVVLQTIHHDYHYEIIFVDDGSPDTTWSEIEKLCDGDEHVRGVRLSRNFGKELAITAGLEHAKGDVVITLDADGQHPVDRIPEFLHEWEVWYEIVYNRRPEIIGASWWKRWTSKIFYRAFNTISEFKLEPRTTDYRLLDRAVVDAYLRFSEKNRMYRWLIDWLGFSKKVLIFDAKVRVHGEASYSYKMLFRLALHSLTSFSFFPLKLVGYMGFLIVFFGGITLMAQFIDKLGITQFGFSNIGIVIVINTIMVWVVLMALGLIGIYIANIHEEVIGRPLYIVKKKKNL
jgi:polyisoprenyl-phosphate glycosyltransferase